MSRSPRTPVSSGGRPRAPAPSAPARGAPRRWRRGLASETERGRIRMTMPTTPTTNMEEDKE
eukprot:9337420-Pyramimonas_sp.AAC.2